MLPNVSDLPVDFGPYRLEAVLGEGGMARVYRARKSGPLGFSTEVALKIVKRKAGKKSEFVLLLTREAVIGGYMRHPNIVATLDFDQVDAHYYIAMEYVEGTTVEALVQQAARNKRALPPIFALDITQQLCRGLSYAHNLADRDGRPLNIIHRDIKPGNIMVSHHGVAKITDFGIAKASVETGVVTATNVVRGTPLYMSPEQATGRTLDHRSDLFSVGLILHELLTGTRLFEMKDIVSTMESIARAHVGEAPERVDALVPGLGRVLRKLLQLRPADRYADGREAEHDIASVASRLTVNETGIDSVRERLGRLTSSAGDTPAVERTPTEPNTENRIPIDLASLDAVEPSQAHHLLESAPPSVDDTATQPWLDPVVRRTGLVLERVAAEDG